MFLFACDESNFVVKSPAGYLVYGGVIAHESVLHTLRTEVKAIKKRFDLSWDAELKWTLDLGSQRENLRFKKAVIKLTRNNSLEMVVYVVPHAIAASKSKLDKFKFAFNVIIQQFEHYLQEKERQCGLILSDQLDSVFTAKERRQLERYLLQVFGWRGTGRLKPRLVVYPPLFLSSSWSILHEIADVLIGGLRFAINNRQKKKLNETCREIMKGIAPLLWKGQGTSSPIGSGFNLYPKQAGAPWYKEELSSLTLWVKSFT